MKEPVCMDCWRRENLTFAQRLDPAFIKPGPKFRCAIHQAMVDADRPDSGGHSTPQAA